MIKFANGLKLFGTALLVSASLFSPNAAGAQGFGRICSATPIVTTVNPGDRFRGSYFVNAGDVVTATFGGDTTNATGSISEVRGGAVPTSAAPTPTPDPGGFRCGPGPSACTRLTQTATGTGQIFVEASNRIIGAGAALGAPGASAAGPFTITTTCTPSGTSGDSARTTGGAAAGGASTTSIGGGINNAVGNRFGSGGNIDASQDRIFLSTRGEDSALVFWTSLEGRSFDGGVNGSGIDLTLGADIELTPDLILGGILSWGDYNLTVGATTVDVDGLTIGAYVAQRLSSTSTFDAYLTYSEPDYLISGTAYTAERWAGAAKMSVDYTMGSVDVRSFGSMSFLREEHPAAVISGTPVAARQVSSLTGSLGSKATYATASPWTPYASLAADFTLFDDGTNGTAKSVSPRIGFGASYDTATTTFQFDFDAGEPFKGTRDYGVRLRYEIRF